MIRFYKICLVVLAVCFFSPASVAQSNLTAASEGASSQVWTIAIKDFVGSKSTPEQLRVANRIFRSLTIDWGSRKNLVIVPAGVPADFTLSGAYRVSNNEVFISTSLMAGFRRAGTFRWIGRTNDRAFSRTLRKVIRDINSTLMDEGAIDF
ncbi:MAG: hypothetical protein JKX97_05410, partial [Candidatus Lindowbacteria bacterium]|nr:hypothetical protein [Candidatus Lindowbacteria bacterium]